MVMRWAPLLILIGGLALVGYGTWYHRAHPSRTVATGQVQTTDPKTGQRVTFERRTREVGTVRQHGSV